jgi:hypothetical protein
MQGFWPHFGVGIKAFIYTPPPRVATSLTGQFSMDPLRYRKICAVPIGTFRTYFTSAQWAS